MKRSILFLQFAAITVMVALLGSGCATTTQYSLECSFDALSLRNIIRDGEPKGSPTWVMIGHSGRILLSHAELSCSAEGRPESRTIAIAEPVANSDAFILLSLDNTALVGSQFEDRELVFEFYSPESDSSDMICLGGEGATYFKFRDVDTICLGGEGATYLIRPGIEKLRLGDFFISTSDAKDWCSVEMTGPPRQPKLTGTGIKIWRQ